MREEGWGEAIAACKLLRGVCEAGRRSHHAALGCPFESLKISRHHVQFFQPVHVWLALPPASCPLPPCSYVAMGCVATLGTVPPPRACIKCLRQDAATRASPDRTPTWTLRPEKATDPPALSGESRQPPGSG